jgi:hypothetical protein
MRFMQKIPSGGIHALLKICSGVIVDFDTYSTEALQKSVSIKLITGATIHPRRANSIRERDGI